MKLLADSSALLALADRRDVNHATAVEFLRCHPHARFVVTELIVAEVATRICARADAARAVAVARSLLDSRRYDLVFTDIEVLQEALERLARFADKRLSLADCASFALMDRLDLREAFAFDRDFRDCGYRMVP